MDGMAYRKGHFHQNLTKFIEIYSLIAPAKAQLLICLGQFREKQHRFASFHIW